MLNKYAQLKSENPLRRRYPIIYSEDLVIHRYRLKSSPLIVGCETTLSIDLGCGPYPRNPFNASKVLGIDINDSLLDNVISCDLLNNPIPATSHSADFVTAFDFIEHIPRVIQSNGQTVFPFVNLISEIYRVLKPGGFFYHRTPAYPYPQSFQDPTHVNIITEETFPMYFCSTDPTPPWANMYGFKGSFKLISQSWVGFYLISLIQANPHI